MNRPFQRKGAKSNTDVGKKFESKIQEYFNQSGLELIPNYAVEIGINSKRIHNFDLGTREGNVIVECKAHTWTEGGNVPSAKLTVWDQAMFYFYLAPSNYRKILFVKSDYSEKRGETLGEYYIRNRSHLIPSGIEIWEFDERGKRAKKIN